MPHERQKRCSCVAVRIGLSIVCALLLWSRTTHAQTDPVQIGTAGVRVESGKDIRGGRFHSFGGLGLTYERYFGPRVSLVACRRDNVSGATYV
jgi:hypothetical protein